MLYDNLSEDSSSNSSSLDINMYQEEDLIQTTTDYIDTDSDNRLIDNGCLKLDNASKQFLAEFNFWVEGVLQTALAFLGLTSNTVFSQILCRRELMNSFNMLLVVLATYDSIYLAMAILESFRKIFGWSTHLQILLFPYVQYPLQAIALTGSIFMTVSISFERYVAVHNPINYNRAMNDAKATRRRVLRFVFPVFVSSALFSLPKFFEATVVYAVINSATNETEPRITHTQLRVDHTYARYVTWSRLVVQSILPVLLLIFFNKKIYQDVKEREERLRPLRYQPTYSSAAAGAAAAAAAARRRRKKMTPASASTPVVNNNSSSSGHNNHNANSQIQNGTALSMSRRMAKQLRDSRNKMRAKNNQQLEQEANSGSVTPTPGSLPATLPGSPVAAVAAVAMRNAKRRRVEDKLALLFICIVIVFFACNLPRMALNIFEAVELENIERCQNLGYPGVPFWVEIFLPISHLLLVANSSANLLIYCMCNAQFRKTARKAAFQLLKKFNLLFCYEKSQFDDARGATAANQLSQLHRQLSSASVVVRKWSRSPRASVRRGNNQAEGADEDDERQHLSSNNHHQLANGDAEKHLSSMLFRRSSTKTTNGSQRSFAAVTAATKLRRENDNNSSAGSSFRSFLNVNNNSCQNSRPVSRVSSVVMFERDNASNINVIAPLLPTGNSGASTPINNLPSPMGESGSNTKLESSEEQKQSEGANKKKSAFRETRI